MLTVGSTGALVGDALAGGIRLGSTVVGFSVGRATRVVGDADGDAVSIADGDGAKIPLGETVGTIGTGFFAVELPTSVAVDCIESASDTSDCVGDGKWVGNARSHQWTPGVTSSGLPLPVCRTPELDWRVILPPTCGAAVIIGWSTDLLRFNRTSRARS